MFRPAFCLAALFCVPTATSAEMHIDISPDGSAWISPTPAFAADLDPFSTPPYWIVQCPGRACFARTGPLVLTLDESGAALLFLDPHPRDGTVSVMIADYAFELEPLLGSPLSPTWEARITDPRATLLTETDDAVAEERKLHGIDLAIDHLRSLSGVTFAGTTNTLSALADAAEHSREGNPRLIPDTKPQIEFAIRAQLDN
ncbi:MAG: hypothetical protein AAF714_03530 [Pseudomonadota bacterium]